VYKASANTQVLSEWVHALLSRHVIARPFGGKTLFRESNVI